MKNYDILIVGNGVLGYSIAFALAALDPTLKIAVFGEQSREGAATSSAGAMLGCFGEVTKYTFRSPCSVEKFKLSLEASAIWGDWLEQLNASSNCLPLKKIIGTIILLNSVSGKLDSENFAEIIKALNKEAEPFEECDPLNIPGLNPKDNYRPLRAIYLPREHAIDPLLLLNSLEAALLENENVTLIKENVIDITQQQEQLIALKTATGSWTAEHYIFAAGTNTQYFIDKIPQLACRIPRTLSGVGCSMLLETSTPSQLDKVIRSPNRAGACGLNLMPRGDLLFLGASNNISLQPELKPKAGICHFLLQCFLEQIDKNAYDANIVQVNVGNRPMSVDTFPLIGKTSIKNMWLLTGTYRDGLHQSPLLAKLLALEIVKGEQNPLTKLFQPERLPLMTCSKEESINEAVLNYMSGGYEHSMQLPQIGWDDVLQRMFQKRVERIYAALDTDYCVPVELILMLDFERNSSELIEYFRQYYKNYQPPLT